MASYFPTSCPMVFRGTSRQIWHYMERRNEWRRDALRWIRIFVLGVIRGLSVLKMTSLGVVFKIHFQ